MSTIKSRVIGGTNVYLPESLPVPAIVEAIEDGIAAAAAAAEAGNVAQTARIRQRQLRDELIEKRTAAVTKDRKAKPANVTAELAKAQAVREAAEIEYQALERVEKAAAGRIHNAVLENLGDLADGAIADAALALTTLVVLIEDAEAARDALYASIGVGHMCARFVTEGGGPIAVQHKPYGYYFSIDAAIEGLNDALMKASEEYDGLRGVLTPGRGEKPKKVRKAVSRASVAAPTPSEPVQGNAGEFTIVATPDE